MKLSLAYESCHRYHDKSHIFLWKLSQTSWKLSPSLCKLLLNSPKISYLHVTIYQCTASSLSYDINLESTFVIVLIISTLYSRDYLTLCSRRWFSLKFNSLHEQAGSHADTELDVDVMADRSVPSTVKLDTWHTLL